MPVFYASPWVNIKLLFLSYSREIYLRIPEILRLEENPSELHPADSDQASNDERGLRHIRW